MEERFGSEIGKDQLSGAVQNFTMGKAVPQFDSHAHG